MAGKLSAKTPDDATRQHNSKDRGRIIREVCRDLQALDAERKSIGEQRREIVNKRIKGDLGMKAADFSTAYRLYLLEGEDRDQLFDTLREAFGALGIGGQASFLDALGEEEGGDAKKPADEISVAADLGAAAGKAGKKLDTCPYPPAKKKLRAAWETSWERAQMDMAEKMGKAPANGAHTLNP